MKRLTFILLVLFASLPVIAGGPFDDERIDDALVEFWQLGAFPEDEIAAPDRAATPTLQSVQVAQNIVQRSSLFTKRFVADASQAQQYLIAKHGFEKTTLMSRDGIELEAMCRIIPNAEYSVVLTGGFLPGKVSGIFAFVELFHPNCNMVFVQSRGRGGSQGRDKFHRLWRYGVDDYLDTVAGIEYIAEKGDMPIVLYGVCAGAFHSMHAVLKLDELGLTKIKSQISGLVFDSGWPNVAEVSKTALPRGIDKILKKCAWKRVLAKALYGLVRPPVMFYHEYWYGDQTDLRNHAHKLQIPLLFVHGQQDAWADFELLQDLIKVCISTNDNVSWWFPDSAEHGDLYFAPELIDQYSQKLRAFVGQCHSSRAHAA